MDDIFYYLFTRVYAAAQAVSHGIRAVHTVIHIDAGVIYKSRVALEINSRGVEHFLISSHGRNGGGRGEIGSRYPSINTRFFQLFSLLFRSNHSSRLVNHRFSRVTSRKKFQDFVFSNSILLFREHDFSRLHGDLGLTHPAIFIRA